MPRSSAPTKAPKEASTALTTFRELGVLPETGEALEAVGITDPFPIQELTLPVALAGNDVIGQAKTGTGKTLGFGIPLLQRIIGPHDVDAEFLAAPGKPQALVVVPTRELCVQVAQRPRAGRRAAAASACSPIYGGRAYEPQVEALRKGVDVVVGTPGRLSTWPSSATSTSAHVQDPRARRGRRDARPRLPARRRAHRRAACRTTGRPCCSRRPCPAPIITLARRYMRQPTHIRADDPDDESGHRRHRRAARLPRARHGQGRAARPHPAGRAAAA